MTQRTFTGIFLNAAWPIAFAILFAIALPQRAAAQAPAHATNQIACAPGVTLRLTSRTPAQGGLLELTLVSASPLADAKVDWAGSPAPIWTVGERTQHALLGVDLERAPGKYDLAVSATQPNGEPLSCKATVTVRDGHFAVEKLSVEGKFVDVSPEDSARAEKESARLHEIYAQVTPERMWTGKFRMPLVGVHKGTNFGHRRVFNGEPRAPHTGLDLSAPAGTKVFAPQRGRVVLAENFFFLGNAVVLDHGLGVYTVYGHLKSISVSVGDVVDAGALLGRVGSTGRATGPHLHWGLVVNGARVNPLQIVALGTL